MVKAANSLKKKRKAAKGTKKQLIPCKNSSYYFYSAEHMAMLAQRVDDMNHGRNVSQHELIEME